MSADEQAILDRVNANQRHELYRCRWSAPDAERLVPQLAQLLESSDVQIVDQTLHAIFLIGTPAIATAERVAKLTQSLSPTTQRLAILTLGQIAHPVPALCVEPLASVINNPLWCRDVLRVLAFIGPQAETALDRVFLLFKDANAKVRKAALETAASIKPDHPDVMNMLQIAFNDRSKIVRDAAAKCLKNRNALNG